MTDVYDPRTMIANRLSRATERAAATIFFAVCALVVVGIIAGVVGAL